ncbi:MAG: hypothetical protein Q8K93_18480, partial [Reyranella sp.]|nr:hypothetical protein [Reyranella sp.]
MLARLSLRTKLALLVAAALLPVLGLGAWHADSDLRKAEAHRDEAVAVAAELAVARHRVLIEGTRRLLVTICADDVVSKSAGPEATPADITGCEMYLARVLKAFPGEYSQAIVTDDKGIARCSSTMTAAGMRFSDREIFRQVR